MWCRRGIGGIRPPQRPKLDPFVPVIDQVPEEDRNKLKRQRHTAKHIHARLRDEHDSTGGITIVTDYVGEKKRRKREVFVPLSHASCCPAAYACMRARGGMPRLISAGRRV